MSGFIECIMLSNLIYYKDTVQPYLYASKICINIVTEIFGPYSGKTKYPEVQSNPGTRHT